MAPYWSMVRFDSSGSYSSSEWKPQPCTDWRKVATLRPLIGGRLLLFAHWLVGCMVLVLWPPSNQDIAKFCCGRGMRRRWLNLDSPVFEIIFTMDLLRRKEDSGGRVLVLVLAVVFGWYLGSVSCFGQNLDSELTFLLQAGKSECFFQTAIKNGTMEVEYQVTVCVCLASRHTSTQCVYIYMPPVKS